MFRLWLTISLVALVTSHAAVGEYITHRTNENLTTTSATLPMQVNNEVTENKLFSIFHMLHFLNPSSLNKEFQEAMRGRASWLTCQLCSAAVSLIQLYPSVSTVQTIFVEMCYSMGYQEYQVCEGISELFGDEFVYILSRSKLTHSEICGLVVSANCMPSSASYPRGEKWHIPLLPLTPELNKTLKERAVQWEPVQNVSSILQLSDVHLDIYYQVNSAAGCKEPLCCRVRSTPTKGSHPAGYWGSFDNCDSVLRTVESLVRTAATDFAPHYRYVLFTGDYIAHDVWNTTKEEIILTTRTLNNLFRQQIPNNKVVLPIIGNHEGYPVDQFCPATLNIEKFSSQWLYEELLDQWKDWIPNEYHDTFRLKGYYSKVDGKARFIALNMNYCARMNFWIAYDYIDLGNMLHWLQLELQNATLSGQYVYLAGHIAPDSDECASHWVAAYEDIIERYASIIRGQFFGHTHFDEFRLYYSAHNSTHPISVAYLSPSVTTYCNVNPAFRLYSHDPNTGHITDHMTYYLNLTKANQEYRQFNPFHTPQAVWEFEYSARDAYNMSSMSPESWAKFAEGVKQNRQLMQRYYRHFGRYDEAQTMAKSMSTMLNLIEDRVFVRV